MRLLHTSDWHVGKTIRGYSRADEHREVLAEIAGIADSQNVDLVLVAGDIFETSAPNPESEQIAFDALLSLTNSGRKVAVISGNHDNARKLKALRPLFERSGVSLITEPLRPADGGVISFEIGGTNVNLAMLPFVSQRGIVRTEQLMGDEAFKHAQLYGDRLGRIMTHLGESFDPDSVNLLMAHAFVTGGAMGGGERPAHIAETYQVSAQSFPVSTNYVALGHLHRAQNVPGPTEIHYCGSPIQMDFGESDQPKQVNVCDVEPGLPVKVNPVFLKSGRPLVTLRGTLSDLRNLKPAENAWIRVHLDEPSRAGIADDVRDILGDNVVDVITTREVDRRKKRKQNSGRSPQDLFGEYLKSLDVDDDRLSKLFADLLDDAETDETLTGNPELQLDLKDAEPT